MSQLKTIDVAAFALNAALYVVLGQRVLIVDDVITAGTAVRESINLIRAAGGEPVGVLIALDRQEKGTGQLSAIQEVEIIFKKSVNSAKNHCK